jgi:NAD(P)-dependent dehydrogenase (short-subunit alcohol dehydrogenase family)
MDFPEPSVKGTGVLVTGAGTGIGREIALEFARRGANVAFHYSQSSEGALSGAAEARSYGVRAEAISADLSELGEVTRLGHEAQKFLGRVDALVNNSGITYNRPFLKVEPDRFEKIYNVNVRAGFFLAQQLAPGMIAAGGGAICNLTSVHGFQAIPEHTVYAGTKGAIIAYTRSLAIELAHRGVRVNAIAPGWIAVENHAKAIDGYTDEAAKAAAVDKVPVGRHGFPIDVARLAVFLCSDAAAFIVGQTVVIDGGSISMMSLVSDFRSESSARFGARYL